MILSNVNSIIGAFLFIFRVWLCEKKIPEILQERRGFLSRFANYYFFIAMLVNFSSDVFNLTICIALPILIIGFVINDIPAYKNFNRIYKSNKKKYWILLEGLTLHPPMIITGIIFYIYGLNNVFSSLSISSAISSLILGIVPLILFDKRWNKGLPVAKWMLVGGIGSWAGVVAYAYFM